MLSVSRKRFASRHKAVCDWGAALQRAAAPYFGLLLTDPWLGRAPLIHYSKSYPGKPRPARVWHTAEPGESSPARTDKWDPCITQAFTST
jgi:hypothetical protein